MIKYAERMKGSQFIVVVALVASMAFSISFASDPSPLQDYCVAIDDIKDGGMNHLFSILIAIFSHSIF